MVSKRIQIEVRKKEKIKESVAIEHAITVFKMICPFCNRIGEFRVERSVCKCGAKIYFKNQKTEGKA